MDYSGNNKIHYTEFIAATQDTKAYLASKAGQPKLDALF